MKNQPTTTNAINSVEAQLIPGYGLAHNIRYEFNACIGRILTILDATMPESKQQTALKSLVRAEMHKLNDCVQERAYGYIEQIAKFENKDVLADVNVILQHAEMEYPLIDSCIPSVD